MVSSIHNIAVYVEGKQLELEQNDINIRLNNVLFRPDRVTTTQSEYSFTFNVPSTKINDKIFGFANTLAQTNKFHQRYSCEVYADEELIFDGSLTIKSYDGEEKRYKCNLVNIKVNSLQDIFQDETMNQIPWYIDFEGDATINYYNANYMGKVWFPYICYGAPVKFPYSADNVANSYTSRFKIDCWNKWWVESFYPSANVMETIRKALEWKGYQVGGTAFNDGIISEIFASCNLADEQVPEYNIGNPNFGYLSLNYTMSTSGKVGTSQSLNFPYYMIDAPSNSEANRPHSQREYNFSDIGVIPILGNANVSLNRTPNYYFDPNDTVYVIPKSGWYKIELTANAQLLGAGETFRAPQWYATFYQGDAFEQVDMDIVKDAYDTCPLEIQLVRNYDQNKNIELIKGSKNIIYNTGNPNEAYYSYRGGTYVSSTYENKQEWMSDYPHLDTPGTHPTDGSSLTESAVQADTDTWGGSNRGTWVHGDGFSRGTTRGGTFGGGRSTTGGRTYGGNLSWRNATYEGYIHKPGQVMPYDPAISPGFICGFSSMGDTTVSVMRRGKSWTKQCTVNNKVFAPVQGMMMTSLRTNGITRATINEAGIMEQTTEQENTYKNATCYMGKAYLNTGFMGRVECCVWLERDDQLSLMAVMRDYTGKKYDWTMNGMLQITAMSTEDEWTLRNDPDWGFYSQTRMPTQLNIGDFFNNETKIADWINDVVKAFNLQVRQEGNVFYFDVNKGYMKNGVNAVDIDDRVNSETIESSVIEYPKTMSVKFNVDKEEWGFEQTVPADKIDLENWYDYGDYGYTTIKLSDDSYVTDSQDIQTNFSYTYWQPFEFEGTRYVDGVPTADSGWTGSFVTPVIEKSEYMIDGYNYEEAMLHDGYSLRQRFFFRPKTANGTGYWVYLTSYGHEAVSIYVPTPTRDGFNISYKDNEISLLTEFFNCSPMLSSNYVTCEAYINPIEYKMLKGGAMVRFDKDLYYPAEITGYDPSGLNPTKLKIIKKV